MNIVYFKINLQSYSTEPKLVLFLTTDCHIHHKGPFKCYVMLFFGKSDPHPPPRNANNIEHYTFVTLFLENLTPPTPIGVT